MNLIDLVEQAHAVVRVYEAGRLVDVVPVRYPEMLTCSSECPYDGGAEVEHESRLCIPSGYLDTPPCAAAVHGRPQQPPFHAPGGLSLPLGGPRG